MECPAIDTLVANANTACTDGHLFASVCTVTCEAGYYMSTSGSGTVEDDMECESDGSDSDGEGEWDVTGFQCFRM